MGLTLTLWVGVRNEWVDWFKKKRSGHTGGLGNRGMGREMANSGRLAEDISRTGHLQPGGGRGPSERQILAHTRRRELPAPSAPTTPPGETPAAAATEKASF